jgi:membrane associated rhomboid family serine protease
MGIHDREYYRDDRTGGTWGTGPTGGMTAVVWIISITVVVHVVQLLGANHVNGRTIDRVGDWLELGTETFLAGQIWRLETYAFLHDLGGLWHILFNMFLLYVTGREFEQVRGSREFVAFYLLAAIVAGLAYLGLAIVLGDQTPVIGASGAVNAVLWWYALRHPKEIWYLFFVIPVPVFWIAVLKAVFDVYPVLVQLGGGDVGDNVAHACHLGGVAFGVLYTQYHWQLTGWWPSRGRGLKSLLRRRPNLKVHRPEEPEVDFDVRVDGLLEKVLREGEASLTADERAVLMEASRRARERSPR